MSHLNPLFIPHFSDTARDYSQRISSITMTWNAHEGDLKDISSKVSCRVVWWRVPTFQKNLAPHPQVSLQCSLMHVDRCSRVLLLPSLRYGPLWLYSCSRRFSKTPVQLYHTAEGKNVLQRRGKVKVIVPKRHCMIQISLFQITALVCVCVCIYI